MIQIFKPDPVQAWVAYVPGEFSCVLFQTQQGSGCDCGSSRRRRCCCAQYVFTRPLRFQKTKNTFWEISFLNVFAGMSVLVWGVGSEVQESHHRTVRLVWFYQAGQNPQKISVVVVNWGPDGGR